MNEQRTAVVVEDDADIRALLTALLTQSGFEVHEAATGRGGVAAVQETDPLVVTVDLGLPDFDGFEVTRQIRQFSDAYVVMLTARGEEIDTLMGLDSGADDYVTKPFRPRELRARIEAMLRRPRSGSAPPAAVSPAPGSARRTAAESAPSGGISGRSAGTSTAVEPEDDRCLHLDGLCLYPDLYEVSVDGEPVTLTPTEFQLLATLLDHGRRVLSKAELFRVLRDEDPQSGTFVSAADERGVEVHIGNLRRKLGESAQQPRWIVTVRGVGYRAVGTPEAC